MNGLIYLAIARIPLGVAVTVEVLGPLLLSVLTGRRPSPLAVGGAGLAGVALLGRGGFGRAGPGRVGCRGRRRGDVGRLHRVQRAGRPPVPEGRRARAGHDRGRGG